MILSHSILVSYHKYHIKYFKLKFSQRNIFSKKFSIHLISFKTLNDCYSKTNYLID